MYYNVILKQDSNHEDDEIPTKETLQKYNGEAVKLIDQQSILHKELTDLTDLTSMY